MVEPLTEAEIRSMENSANYHRGFSTALSWFALLVAGVFAIWQGYELGKTHGARECPSISQVGE